MANSAMKIGAIFALLLMQRLWAATPEADVWKIAEQHDADSAGVKIHYAAMGKGPLIIMIHGFPDFWYTWRKQMAALSEHYRVVAVDQRGYDLSDRPVGVAQYAMPLLVNDIGAVIRAEGRSDAVIVGHDWGGVVAWTLAMTHPEWISNLVILNLPHPNGITREIINNPEQRKNSQYAFNFQKPDAEKGLTAEGLTRWVTDPAAKPHYLEAFNRSDFTAMLNYYRANYPKADAPPPTPDAPLPPKVTVPVLMFHGLNDQALLPGALSGTWEWVSKDLTLVTVPGAGHFVQQDAADLVTTTMSDWLGRRVH